jgi:glutathione S-transferase
MAIEFFWMPGGPFALRCLMALAVKGLPYHSRRLDVSKQENRSPEFLAISPSGTLPVMKDDATVVRESQAIMFYLDRAYPSVPLYGETPVEVGRTMQEICEQHSYAEPVLTAKTSACRSPGAMHGDSRALQPERSDRSCSDLLDLRESARVLIRRSTMCKSPKPVLQH